jgi:hypothetical protein
MNIEHSVQEDTSLKPVQGGYVVLKEKKTYTFTNRLPGMIFFTREDGVADAFEGNETKDNITEKERKILKANEVYKQGYLIEEVEEEEIEKVESKNALSDHQVNILIAKHKNDVDYLTNWITGMDSEFAISKIKQAFIEHNLNSSLIVYCDYKIQQIQEELKESMKAPVDKPIAE